MGDRVQRSGKGIGDRRSWVRNQRSERDGRDWRNGIGDQALTTRIGIRASGIGDWILGIRHQGSKVRCQGSGTEDGNWG